MLPLTPRAHTVSASLTQVGAWFLRPESFFQRAASRRRRARPGDTDLLPRAVLPRPRATREEAIPQIRHRAVEQLWRRIEWRRRPAEHGFDDDFSEGTGERRQYEEGPPVGRIEWGRRGPGRPACGGRGRTGGEILARVCRTVDTHGKPQPPMNTASNIIHASPISNLYKSEGAPETRKPRKPCRHAQLARAMPADLARRNTGG